MPQPRVEEPASRALPPWSLLSGAFGAIILDHAGLWICSLIEFRDSLGVASAQVLGGGSKLVDKRYGSLRPFEELRTARFIARGSTSDIS